MPTTTFFFYDLETSGVSPRSDRIMQFAGQRTDIDLKPIGEPYNILIRLTEDILPEPDAVLITGITPQKTLSEGITEAEFSQIFKNDIVKPGTIFTGFNNVRFDDEFIRFLLFRNFYDPYSWHWQDGCSRWDLLDVVRMTRALRPAGIEWPFDSKGKATNRLEYLTSVNKLDHFSAHDALSDVNATIAMARLIKNKQPKLFDYLLSMKNKHAVEKLVEVGRPFVYSSGKYDSEYEKTTVAVSVCTHPEKNGNLVYDLRYDPAQFINLTAVELAKIWQYDAEKKKIPLPIKVLQFNRVPAVAPLNVLDKDSQKRLGLDLEVIEKHRKMICNDRNFTSKLDEALSILNAKRSTQVAMLVNEVSVDAQLYDDFIPNVDRKHCELVHNTKPAELHNVADNFKDERLKKLLPIFKARNFSEYLTDTERQAWEKHRHKAILAGGEQSRLAKFSKRLAALSSETGLDPEKRYILEELHLYAQSILPED